MTLTAGQQASPAGVFTTRAELRASQVAAVADLRAADLSLRRLAEGVGWTLLLLVLGVVGPFVSSVDGPLPDQSSSVRMAAGLLLVVALGGLPVRALVRLQAGASDVRRRLAAWEWLDAESVARAVPRGDLAPELRTPWDARDDPDADRVRAAEVSERLEATWPTGLAVRAVVQGPVLVLGLVCLVASGMTRDDGEVAAVYGAWGVVLTVVGGACLGGTVRRVVAATTAARGRERDAASWGAPAVELAPLAGSFATRAELRVAQVAEVAQLREADLSQRRLLAGAAWTWWAFLAIFACYATAMPEGLLEGAPAPVRLLAGLVVGAAWGWAPVLALVRLQVRATSVRRRLEAWEWLDADPVARALPRGDLAPELGTPWDARHDPDADQVRAMAVHERAWAFTHSGMITRVLGVVPLTLGAVLLAGAVLPVAARGETAVLFGMAGTLLTVVGGVCTRGALRRNWAMHLASRRLQRD